MQNGHQTQSDSLPITVAADATVGDLLRELLRFSSGTTGLPKGILICNGIIVTHHGQELNPNDALSDAGVCSESLLFYKVKDYDLKPIRIYKPVFDKRVALVSIDWDYNIPFGHRDVMSLMVQQTRERIPNITDGTTIDFAFVFMNATRINDVAERVFQVSVPKVYAQEIHGKVLVIDKLLERSTRRINYGHCENFDDAGNYFRHKRLKYVVHVRVIAGEPHITVTGRPADMNVWIDVPDGITFVFYRI